MAQLVIAAAGAVAGNALGWGIASLGLSGAAVGWTVGSLLGSALIKPPAQQGPRLGDLRVTGTEYGQPIPFVAGTPRISGQVAWASTKREIPNTQKVGKGGGQKVTTYTYEVDLLILLSENPINGVKRVWSNGELVRSPTAQKEGVWNDFRVYLGDDTQLPDPTYEAAVGVGNAPAYRGRGYVFIQSLQLGNGGQIPNLTFEVDASTQILNFTEYFNTEIDPSTGQIVGYDYNAENGILTPDKISSFELNLDSGGNPRLQVSQRQNAGRINISRDMPGKPFLNFKFQFRIINDSTANCGYIQVGSPAGRVIALLPRSESSFDTNRRMSLAFGTGASLAAVGTSPLVIGDLYEFRVSRTDTDTNVGNWELERVGFGVVLTGSGTINWNFSDLSFVSDNNTFPGGAWSVWDNIEGEYINSIGGAANNDTLGSVASALMVRAGYALDQFDITDVPDESIRGLALGNLTNTRTVLEALQSAYAFTVSKTNVVRMLARRTTPVFTIPYSDLNARPEFSGNEDALNMEKTNDLSIPGQVAVSFNNMASDYVVATEYSDRLRSTQVSTQEVQLPLGLLPEEGKRAADRLLFDLVSSSVKTTIKLPLKYAALEPSDIFDVVDADGQTYRLRCEQKTDMLPMLEVQCVLDDVGTLDTDAITDDGYTSTDTVRQLAQTGWESLDIPLLRDEDDSPGWYAAVYPVRTDPTDEWPGGVYVKSPDNVVYQQVDIIGEGAAVGVCENILPDHPDAGVLDTSSELLVTMLHGELAGVTLADILLSRETNVFLVGNELMQAYDVSLVAPGQYRVRGMIRGLRGTEREMAGHASAERFVALDLKLRNATHGVGDVGNPLFVKAVTLNGILDNVTEETFTDTGVRLKPFDVAQLLAVPVGSDIVVTWNRRTRRQYRYGGDNPVVPLGEDTEAYRVEVYDGATLVRTETVTTPTYTYTAAAAAADGFASAETVTFVVAQLSGTIGPGYPSTTQGTLP